MTGFTPFPPAAPGPPEESPRNPLTTISPASKVKDMNTQPHHRFFVGIFYCPPSQKAQDALVTMFSVRKHKRANPGMDEWSDEFMDTLPEMPPTIVRLFDALNRRSNSVIARWADRYAATGKKPPKRYKRPEGVK